MVATEIHTTCVYFLTRSYTLHSIGGGWNEFAEENGAPQLTSESVVGHSLWDYISDPATKHFYSNALKRVLKSGRPVSMAYRCDAPDWRRSMKLRMIRTSHDLCEIISTTAAAEPRPWVELLDDTVDRSDFWLPICSWCKRVAVDEHRWLEAEDAQVALRENEVWPFPRLVHATCPDCQGRLNGIC